MEYKKISNNKYNIHLINTDRFKLVTVNVYFSKKSDPKEFPDYFFLVRYLSASTKKLNTEIKFNQELENLYSLHSFTHSSYSSDMYQFEIGLEFLHPKYTEDAMWKRSFDMLGEIVVNPNIKNNEFDNYLFEIYKKTIKNTIESKKENPVVMATHRYSPIFYKNTPYERPLLPTLDELEKTTPKSVYNLYKKFFNNYDINVMVLGEISEKENDIIKYIEKIFSKFETRKDTYKFYFEPHDDKLIEVSDEAEFNQSQLVMGYNFKNLTNYERDYVLVIYTTILGVMNNSMLFNVVREEHGLCYNIGASHNRFTSSLVIESGINKENCKKAVSLIKKCVETMKDENVVSQYIDNAKNMIATSLNDFYDDAFRIMDYYYVREFMAIDDVVTRKDKLKKVTASEVSKLNNKIKLQLIYLLKGMGE